MIPDAAIDSEGDELEQQKLAVINDLVTAFDLRDYDAQMESLFKTSGR